MPGAILADASWLGTLAAARDLGARGVRVTVAADRVLAPARWSRYVSRVVSCPPVRDADRFLEWLVAFAPRGTGAVLYPTSDDVAWLISANRDTLARHYRLYSPPASATARLLDKSRLHDAARAAGLDVPETRYPHDEHDADRLGRELGVPLLVKPRIQVLSRGRARGLKAVHVMSERDLARAWRTVHDSLSYHPWVLEQLPDADHPMLQVAYTASERIYTVDGFIDESGELFVLRACNKVLQQPRRVGPGVCFDDAPVDAALARGLRTLLHDSGFFGVFDAEFLAVDGKYLLIDVNPRFYNHMAYEVARGMPLPWLAYLAALGDTNELRRSLDAASCADDEGRIYVHRLLTQLLLAGQAVVGGMSAAERHAVHAWWSEHSTRTTDPALARDDPLPGIVDVGMLLAQFARHPRAVVRGFLSKGQARM